MPGPVLRWCLVLTAALLVLVAVTGPLYAFLVVSCTSTRSCSVGRILQTLNMECTETRYGGQSISVLLHGEECNLRCFEDTLRPSLPALMCDDGTLQGMEELQCEALPVFVSQDTIGGLVSGAVTGGDDRDACLRARDLLCEAVPGGTSVLVQLGGLTKNECDELMAECRDLNPVFDWAQHVRDEAALGGVGSCTLGCFRELLPEEELQRLEAATNALPAGVGGSSVEQPAAAEGCAEGPVCVKVTGSCNPDDNGDYFRYPFCAAGMPQWVHSERDHRIRYDGTPRYSQGGKWLLESGIDPDSAVTGVERARQPNFDLLPVFGTTVWNFQCLTHVNAFTVQVSYRAIALSLDSCTCTRDDDCSGNGMALGSKLDGPNCYCQCDLGFSGDHCEIEMCIVPDVLNAREPPCTQGRAIEPGAICSPRCQTGYFPTADFFTCTLGTLLPTGFECRSPVEEPAAVDLSEALSSLDEFGVAPTPPAPECTDLDCNFRGTPTGERRPDGSCVCDCFPGMFGLQCRRWQGECIAPLQSSIPHARTRPCLEGSNIETICNAQCEPGYYPLPAQLECRGVDLAPTSFRCFGGPSVRETWCQAMQHIAIIASAIAVLMLLSMCLYFGTSAKRTFNVFMKNHVRVEVEQDREGIYNVVRMEGKDIKSTLPKHLVYPVDTLDPTPALHDTPYAGSGTSPGGVDAHTMQQLRHLADVSLDASQAPHAIGDDTQLAVEAATSSSRFRMDQRVQLRGLVGYAELNGAYGWLGTFDPATGLWWVALDGADELNQVPESCIAAVATEDAVLNTGWLVEMRQVEGKVLEAKRTLKSSFRTQEQLAEIEAAKSIAAALESTAAERAEVEGAMRRSMARGDAASLRAEAARARELLERVRGAPAASTAGLARLLPTAESRLEQFDEREAARSRHREYQQRIARGEAADWNMTPAEFWKHAEASNIEKIRAGLRAKLPLFSRSSDGQRLTIVHAACRGACADEEGSDRVAKRIAVVGALLQARAHANAVDVVDRTPLDLAVCEGGEGAGESPVVKALRDLGLQTAQEAAAEAREARAGGDGGGGGMPKSPSLATSTARSARSR